MINNNISHPGGYAKIYTFLGIATLFATLGYYVAFSMGDENRAGGVFIVQFSPMIAAFATNLIFQRSLRGMGWGWGKTRYQFAACITPFILALVSFSLVWILGFGGFYDEAFIATAQGEIGSTFGVTLSGPYVTMLVLILLNGTVGLFAAFGAIGEELGWRGFLVPELYKHCSFTKTSFISGAIWSVYHYPLLVGLMAPRLEVSFWPLLVATMIGGIGLTFILNWFRIKSGSVWTAVIFHAALNIHIQGLFQNLTVKTSWLTHYISGEHGFMLAMVSAVVGYLFWRQRSMLPAANM